MFGVRMFVGLFDVRMFGVWNLKFTKRLLMNALYSLLSNNVGII